MTMIGRLRELLLAHRRGWWAGLVSIGLSAFLAACGGGATPTIAPTVGSVPTAPPSPTRVITPAATASRAATATTTRAASPAATTTRTPMAYPDVVRLASEALASELNVPREQITVVRFEAHDWPDSSLGCPQPGRTYLQVITPGYRVILAAGGREYEYHTNQTAMVTRC